MNLVGLDFSFRFAHHKKHAPCLADYLTHLDSGLLVVYFNKVTSIYCKLKWEAHSI